MSNSASGLLFESGVKHRIRLSVGQVTHTTEAKKHPLGASKKPVVWEEGFKFDISLPTDFLAVTCVRANAKGKGQPTVDVQVGALTIALAHLPQATEVTKWYELKSGGQSVAVLQLRLCYNLTYSIHRRDATSSLTIVPSQPAREFLRKELFRYARQNKLHYRFIDYFLVVGSSDGVRPSVLERYPLIDRSDFAIPNQIETFCYPNGYKLSTIPRETTCFSFRLNNQTELHTDQTVAAVLTYWIRTLVPRHQAEESSSPSEDDAREPSRSVSSFAGSVNGHGVDEFDDRPPRLSASSSFNSNLGPPAATAATHANPSATNRRSSTHHPLSTKPDFHAASPLSLSYRVTPASSSSAHRRPSLSNSSSQSRLSTDGGKPSCPSPELMPTTSYGGHPPNDDDFVTLWQPKSIVILSRLSFVSIYKDILVTLFQHFISTTTSTPTTPSDAASSASAPSDADLDSCSLCDPLDSPVDSHPHPHPDHPHHHPPRSTCSIGLQSLSQHNASIQARESQAVPVLANFAPPTITMRNTTGTNAGVTTTENNPNANVRPANGTGTAPSPPLPPTTGLSSSFHRMDLSGMSSNLTRPVSQTGDFSALGSVALPATPITHEARRLQTSPTINVNIPSGTNAPTALPTLAPYQPPHAPTSLAFPFHPSMISSSGAIHASCSSACCPCSCCTFRTCCLGRSFEQYLIYLVDEVPLPTPGHTAVQIQVACRKYTLRLPASELDFPQLEFTLHHQIDPYAGFGQRVRDESGRVLTPALVHAHMGLLQVLDIEVILLILRCILSEMKLIFHSSSCSLLHSITESLIQLCFPFQWSHIYIPILPRELYQMLEAPVSFIVGVESSGMTQVEEMLGVNKPTGAGGEAETRRRRQRNATNEEDTDDESEAADQSSVSQHDLSTFAFIDIDLGTVDLTVPPPPFPPTSQKSLIRNIRHLTKQDVWHGDSIASGVGSSSSFGSCVDSMPIVPSHFGGNFHQHYHLATNPTTPTPTTTHHTTQYQQHDTSTDRPTFITHAAKGSEQTPYPFVVSNPFDSLRSPSTSPLSPMWPARSPYAASRGGSGSPISPSTLPPSSPPLFGASPPPHSVRGDSGSHTAGSDDGSNTARREHPFCTNAMPMPKPGVRTSILVSGDAHRPFDRALRIEFLQFLASLIANYRDHLFFVGGASPVFDTPSFLSLKGRSESLPFLSRFLETQIFRDFLDRHVEFPSYLQDYLLYINSHGDTNDETAHEEHHEHAQHDDTTPKVFTADLPPLLDSSQRTALVGARSHHFSRLLASYDRLLPDATAPQSHWFMRSSSTLLDAGWQSRAMPLFGLLAPGALRPTLPEKKRSRSNSVAGTPAAQTPTTTIFGHTLTPTPIQVGAGILASPRSAIFPPTRSMHVGVSVGSAGVVDEPISLGKNPSTLNHTLLFSKMYDGLASSLAEAASASGNSTRTHTPRIPSNEFEAYGNGGGWNTKKGSTPTGLNPVEMDLFMHSPRATGADVDRPTTTSIFQQAFDKYGPHATNDAIGADNMQTAESQPTPQQCRPGRDTSPNLSISITDPIDADGGVIVGPTPLSRASSQHLRGASSSSSSTLNASGASAAGVVSTSRTPRSSLRRQMSLNLLSKSDFEKRKPRDASRLGQVIALLMAPRTSHNGTPASSPSAATHVDLGELSAVGELLALPEWRQALVDVFGTDTENSPHKQLPTSAFLSLSLLFNIALEECNTDSDYLTALSLLHIAGRVFNLPGVEVVDPPIMPAHNPYAQHTPTPTIEREYLRSCLKRQQLWRDPEFWIVAYHVDIHAKLAHPTPTTTPIGSSPLPPTIEERDSIVFENIAGLIYLQLSLGVNEDLVRSSVSTSCSEFSLSHEKQTTLNQLVANIRRTTETASISQANAMQTQQNVGRPIRGGTASEQSHSHTTRAAVVAPTLQYPHDEE